MITKIANTSNVSNIMLFDLNSKIFIAKDDGPIDMGKIIR